MPERVEIDGKLYRPIDEVRARELAEYIEGFQLEGTAFWRDFFVKNDYGMYAEGDENAPFFSEAFLYNLLGKDEARSVLGIMRRLCDLAGVEANI